MALNLNRDFDAPQGEAVEVAPGLRRLLAPNPGPFTFKGTGVYIVGTGEVAVIDPGPDDPVHIAALKDALKDESIRHILITHTHRDHSPAAKALKVWSGAKTYGFGPHGAGRDPDHAVEEGGDRDFVPDIVLKDGEAVSGAGYHLSALHTPGHAANHLCYAWDERRALFTGDHVMGWSTSVVVPPDGDMGDYIDQLERLTKRGDAIYWPTHGGPITEPQSFVRDLITHRQTREAEILNSVREGVADIPSLVARVYAGLSPRLFPAAGQSVLAHLILLERKALVQRTENRGEARFIFAI